MTVYKNTQEVINDLDNLFKDVENHKPGTILKKLRTIIDRTHYFSDRPDIHTKLKKKFDTIRSEITFDNQLDLEGISSRVMPTLRKQNKEKNNDILKARIADIMSAVYLAGVIQNKKIIHGSLTYSSIKNTISLIQGIKLILDTRQPEQAKIDAKINKLAKKLEEKKELFAIQRPKTRKKPRPTTRKDLTTGEALNKLDRLRLRAYNQLDLLNEPDAEDKEYKKLYRIYKELINIKPQLRKGIHQKYDAQNLIEKCLNELKIWLYRRLKEQIKPHLKKAYLEAAEKLNNDENKKEAQKCFETVFNFTEQFIRKNPPLDQVVYSDIEKYTLWNWYEKSTLEQLIYNNEFYLDEYNNFKIAITNWKNRTEERRIEYEKRKQEIKKYAEEINNGYETVAKLYDKNKPNKAEEERKKIVTIYKNCMNALETAMKPEFLQEINPSYRKYKNAKGKYIHRKNHETSTCVDKIKILYEEQKTLLENDTNPGSIINEKVQAEIDELVKIYQDEEDEIEKEIYVRTTQEREEYEKAADAYIERKKQKRKEAEELAIKKEQALAKQKEEEEERIKKEEELTRKKAEEKQQFLEKRVKALQLVIGKIITDTKNGTITTEKFVKRSQNIQALYKMLIGPDIDNQQQEKITKQCKIAIMILFKDTKEQSEKSGKKDIEQIKTRVKEMHNLENMLMGKPGFSEKDMEEVKAIEVQITNNLEKKQEGLTGQKLVDDIITKRKKIHSEVSLGDKRKKDISGKETELKDLIKFINKQDWTGIEYEKEKSLDILNTCLTKISRIALKKKTLENNDFEERMKGIDTAIKDTKKTDKQPEPKKAPGRYDDKQPEFKIDKQSYTKREKLVMPDFFKGFDEDDFEDMDIDLDETKAKSGMEYRDEILTALKQEKINPAEAIIKLTELQKALGNKKHQKQLKRMLKEIEIPRIAYIHKKEQLLEKINHFHPLVDKIFNNAKTTPEKEDAIKKLKLIEDDLTETSLFIKKWKKVEELAKIMGKIEKYTKKLNKDLGKEKKSEKKEPLKKDKDATDEDMKEMEKEIDMMLKEI